MNSYFAITRTIIMFGTIMVGAMAWKVYGPPPEQLAPIVDRVAELAAQAVGREQANPSLSGTHPPRQAASPSLLPLPAPSGASLRVDREVAPATVANQAPPYAQPQSARIDELLAPLRSLGVVDAELKPWGATGQTYRCACRVASAENPTLERHFDAVAADAQSAVEQVVGEIEQWRKRTAI
jgi:hypothetical protein